MLDILCQNEKQHTFGHGDIRACPNPLSFIMSPATLPNQPSLVGIDLGEMRCLSSSALQLCSILDCIFKSVSSTAILQQSGCLKTLQTKNMGTPKEAKTILYSGINPPPESSAPLTNSYSPMCLMYQVLNQQKMEGALVPHVFLAILPKSIDHPISSHNRKVE